MLILTVVAIVAVLAFGATVALELRAHRRKNAAFDALLSCAPGPETSGALDGLAVATSAGVRAPLTGRLALAFHVEVITRETHGDEVVTTRLLEESGGSLGLARDGRLVAEADLTSATSLTPVTEAFVLGATVFSSATSMFANASVPPHQVAHFLASRGLPFPRQDALFQAGRKLTVNERVVLPDQPIWIAGRAEMETSEHGQELARFAADSEQALHFGLGSLAQARQARQPKTFDVVWAGFVVAMLLSIFAGMFTALILPLIVSRFAR